jgi:hypothetical protein
MLADGTTSIQSDFIRKMTISKSITQASKRERKEKQSRKDLI